MKNFLVLIAVVAVVGVGYVVLSSPKESETNQASTSIVSDRTSISYVAGAYQTFSQGAYEKALADGKTVILDFHADWCPTCVANKKIIEAEFEANLDTNLVGFQVNYDTEREMKRAFNVTIQGMIIKTTALGEIGRLGPNPTTTKEFVAFMKSS